MDLLANTVLSMAQSMKAMQRELVELQADRANSSWNHLQEMSVESIANITDVPLLTSSPTCPARGTVAASHPALVEEPVTLAQLRSVNNQQRAAEQHATLQREAEREITGEELNTKMLKTSRCPKEFARIPGYGFPAGCGAHALVLSFIEEGRLNWLDLSAIQKV